MGRLVGTVSGHLRDRSVMILGAAALLGGLFALFAPIVLDDYDQRGVQITCGSAYSAQLHQATVADQAPAQRAVAATDYVDACRSAVAQRRIWTLPVVGLGALILAADAVMWARSGSPRSPTGGTWAQMWADDSDERMHDALDLDRRDHSHQQRPLDTMPFRHHRGHGDQS